MSQRYSTRRDGPREAAKSSEPALSIIATGSCVTGELTSDGVVKIEGKIVGSVRAELQVLVAKGGLIEGDVYTREAVVGGEVRGSILADERVEVQASATIHGDITTQRIVVHEGGEVNGNVRMANPNALDPPDHSTEVAATERPAVAKAERVPAMRSATT